MLKNMRLKILIVCFILLVSILIGSTVFAKYILATSEILIIETNLDRTSPILQIEYSNQELTNTDIQVTITSNEPIKNIYGWTLLEDGKTLVKTYNQNIQKSFIITDLNGNSTNANININNIDKNLPIAEIIEINNTNIGYEKYANKSHDITVKVKIFDDNKIIKKNNDFIVLVGTQESGATKQINVIEENEKYLIYEIKLSNITENGQLEIKIPENSFEDMAGNILNEIILDTGILIDNIAPTTSCTQQILSNGKALVTIDSDETLREIDGWTYSDEINTKEFIFDIKYQRPVKDLAGNESMVNMNIQGSTFLGLEVKAHMSNVGWENSQINANTVGRMEAGSYKYKFETLLFRTSQNVDDDFLRISGFINTYWGENSDGISGQFGIRYNYGYNPKTGYRTMGNTQLVEYEGKQYIPLASEGANFRFNTDINGENPIPVEIARQYFFGISGLKLELKSYEESSIVYQMFFNDTGWQETYKNGEEAMRAKDKPIEAMRYGVVPTSELEFVVNYWNRDIGTYNVD